MSERSNPFEEIERLVESLTDDFDEPFRPIDGASVDVVDRGDAYVVRADLPGYDRDDIEVTVEDGRLSIRAERTTESLDEGERYVRRERQRGATTRTVGLPGPVQEREAAATHENGVLTVTLPRESSDEGTQIDVE